MGCGCKKKKKGEKSLPDHSSNMNSKEMQELIRQKIREQIQTQNPPPNHP